MKVPGLLILLVLFIPATPNCDGARYPAWRGFWVSPCDDLRLVEKFENVSRSGDTLEIATSQNTTVFINNTAYGESSVRHYVVGYFDLHKLKPPRKDFLVFSQYWEGIGYTLVNGRTGDALKLLIFGEIVLSPDMTRYVAASCDLQAGYHRNLLQVYRTEDYQLEWTYDCDEVEWGTCLSDPVWLDNDRILLARSKLVGQTDTVEMQPVILEFGDTTWSRPRVLE